MPRAARFTINNGVYHVMVRGNNRKNIFHDDDDFTKYIDLIKDNKKKYDLKIYHYVLMNNHAHIIIKSQYGKNLSEAMKRVGVSYTRYYRKKHKGIGHLFQDRFKSYVIQEGIYLLECGRYIELNPVRANIIKEPKEYKWTSYPTYVEGEEDGVVDKNPEYLSLNENEEKRKAIYREYVESGGVEKREEERFFKEGVYGTKEFIRELRLKGLKPIWSHGGRPKKRLIK